MDAISYTCSQYGNIVCVDLLSTMISIVHNYNNIILVLLGDLSFQITKLNQTSTLLYEVLR